MIQITINGQTRAVMEESTICDLVATESGRTIGQDGRAQDGRGLGIAVAKNAHLVPRSRWFSELLADGDAVELLTATQGG